MTKEERLRLAKEYLEVHNQVQDLRNSLREGEMVENELATRLLADIPPGKMGKATVIAETLIWVEEQEDLDRIQEVYD